MVQPSNPPANKNLFSGTRQANKDLFAGTLPADKNLFTGIIQANKNLFAGTLALFQGFQVVVNSNHFSHCQFDYTPVGRMTVVRIEYLSIITIACWTIIRRFQLSSFQDFSDFFEQMYNNDYPLIFVRQY